MIWPSPTLYWDDGRDDEIPKALSCYYMDDAWNGGNNIRISFSCPSSEEATAAYRALWLPIQSLHLIVQGSYEAHAIYKLEHNHTQDLETEIALSFKSLPGSQDVNLVPNVVSTSTIELMGGSTKLTIEFNISGNELQLTTAVSLMPILGDSVPPSAQPLYFESLLELDKWTPGQAGDRYGDVWKFKLRGSDPSLEKSRRKLQKKGIKFKINK